MSPTRRALMAAGMALGAAGVSGPAHSRGAKLKPGDAASIFFAGRRMRYCSDDRLFFWWLRGLRYGQLENKLTPLFGMNVISIMQVRASEAETYSVTKLEIVVNTDLATNAPLKEWINPYTNEARTARSVPVGPLAVRQTMEGSQSPESLPGARLAVTKIPPGPMLIAGDDVWLKSDSAAEVTQIEGSAPPYRVNDFAEYHASRRAVENVRQAFVPTTSQFVAITGWQRWMGMGARPGGSIVRGAGRKAQRWSEIPMEVRGPIEAIHPAIAADPAKALDAPTNRFDR